MKLASAEQMVWQGKGQSTLKRRVPLFLIKSWSFLYFLRLGLVSVADLPLQLGIMSNTKKRRAAVPSHIPEEGASLRYILKNCVDIREPPKKASSLLNLLMLLWCGCLLCAFIQQQQWKKHTTSVDISDIKKNLNRVDCANLMLTS